MNEFIKKLIERLEYYISHTNEDSEAHYAYKKCKEEVNQLAEEYKDLAICNLKSPCYYKRNDIVNPISDGWIPCEKQMPPVETEVWIVAKRKWRDGTCRYITTTAMYEDGTVLENDSCWRWEDIDGEWDDEAECCIIPKGWWENKHYNGDGELNHAVDDEVIAWQPLPVPYQPKGD